MRIAPIEKPKGLLTRIAYWMSRRQLGKVMTPLKVVFARIPGTIFHEYALVRILEGNKLKLDPMLRLLVQHHVARLNGCGFCVDIGRAAAVQHRVDLGKIDAVSEYRGNPLFSERERAALARRVSKRSRSRRRSPTSRRRRGTSAWPTRPSRRCADTATIVRSWRSRGSARWRTTSTS